MEPDTITSFYYWNVPQLKISYKSQKIAATSHHKSRIPSLTLKTSTFCLYWSQIPSVKTYFGKFPMLSLSGKMDMFSLCRGKPLTFIFAGIEYDLKNPIATKSFTEGQPEPIQI